MDIRKLKLLFITALLLAPKINTTKVCINIYKESNPNTLGVNILLLAIVWNIIEEKAIEPAVKDIANTFRNLLGNT